MTMAVDTPEVELEDDAQVLAQVTKREELFNWIWSRMDTDELLYLLQPYKLKDFAGDELSDVINVTMNDPNTYAKRVMAGLGAFDDPQVVVDSDDENGRNVEQFLHSMFPLIDERLSNQDLSGLFEFLKEQLCIRGRIHARVYLSADEQEFSPDVLPLDARGCSYDTDVKGLKWHSCVTGRSLSELKDKYPLAEDIKADPAQVRDVWTRKSNMIWGESKLLKNEIHGLDYVPVAVEKCISGSQLQTRFASTYSGESLFESTRDLYPELNRLASILQTMDMWGFMAPLQKEEDEVQGSKKPTKPPRTMGAVVPVKVGQKYSEIPVADIKAAARLFMSILETRLQRGALPGIDYGNLTFPLSAVAIGRLTAAKDQVFLPRIQTFSIFYRKLCTMLIKQYIMRNITAEMGQGAEKQIWTPEQLSGDHVLNFRFHAVNPEQQIANFSIAVAAERWMADDDIRETVLELEDPAGVKQRWEHQRAERLDPAIALRRAAKAALKEGDAVEALMLAERGVALIKQRKLLVAGQPTEPQTEERPGQPVVPLMDKGSSGASQSQGLATLPTTQGETQVKDEEE